MKRFIYKIILLLVLIVSLDFVLGHLLEYLYFKQKKGKSYRITNVLENINHDILIFGSSRAVQHYDPSIIEEMTGLSAYNVGQDGQTILYHKAILDVILTRYHPKAIVLELTEGMDFRIGNSQYDKLSALLPYVRRYPSIKELILKRSNFEKFKLLSKIYPYNSLLLRIIEGNLDITNTDMSGNGFVPKKGNWDLPIKAIDNSQSENYDEDKVMFFYDFVELCEQEKIPLFVVISPEYRICNNCFSFSQKVCDSAKIQLHNYSQEKSFVSNIKYFENPAHLNAFGAKIYSEFISLELVDCLKTENKE